MSTCTVCTHSQLAFINEALRQGVSLRVLEQEYNLSRSSLSRHAGHTPDSVSPDPDAPDPADASQPPAPPGPAATAGPLPTTRLKTCFVCMLPDDAFSPLEAALDTREPSQSLALEHHVSLSQLVGHVQHRASEALSRQRYEAEQRQAPPETDDPRDPAYRHSQVQREIPSLVAEADRLHQAALRAAGLGPVLFVVRDMGALLVKLAQAIAGEEG